jgi:pseudouridine kinase
MTQREQEVFEALRREPAISQQELADRLGITRSSVAVHITNLLKKGYLLGKGYILRSEPYALVIGGSNVDITGFPRDRLVLRDSNIGEVRISLGGVGRNIAENLARLGRPTRLISVVGDDLYGRRILEEAAAIGLDMRDSIVLRDRPTSTYLCIMDESRDMAVAINHMDSIEAMTVDYLQARRGIIENAQVCVLDTNLPEPVLDYLLSAYPSRPDFFLDPVSASKAARVRGRIGRFHTIKPNRLEAEVLSGLPIRGEGDLERCAQVLHSQGVRRIFISLGPDGVFASEPGRSWRIPNHEVAIVNATGAGDAFMAGLAYAHLTGQGSFEAAQTALAASAIAISHESTINPHLSEATLTKLLKEYQHHV